MSTNDELYNQQGKEKAAVPSFEVLEKAGQDADLVPYSLADTFRAVNIIFRHLPQHLAKTSDRTTISKEEFDVCLSLVAYTNNDGSFNVAPKDIETFFASALGKSINRQRIYEHIDAIYEKSLSISTQTFLKSKDGKPGKETVKLDFRPLNRRGYTDKEGKEIEVVENRLSDNEKNIKTIIGRFDEIIMYGLRGQLEGYINLDTQTFRDVSRQLNQNQKKLVYPLLVESKAHKDLPWEQVEEWYDIKRKGRTQLDKDIADLKEKKIIGTDSEEQTNKKNPNSKHIHLVKGGELSKVPAPKRENPLKLPEAEIDVLEDGQAVVASTSLKPDELREKVKHIMEKREFSLNDTVDKIQNCLRDLLSKDTLTESQGLGFSIRDKTLLSKKLLGQRNFSATEVTVLNLFVETYG